MREPPKSTLSCRLADQHKHVIGGQEQQTRAPHRPHACMHAQIAAGKPRCRLDSRSYGAVISTHADRMVVGAMSRSKMVRPFALSTANGRLWPSTVTEVMFAFGPAVPHRGTGTHPSISPPRAISWLKETTNIEGMRCGHQPTMHACQRVNGYRLHACMHAKHTAWPHAHLF